jgi:hypothetical protein
VAGTIRANPESRLPGRARRSSGIARDIRVSAALTLRAVARMPWLFLVATAAWGAARFACRQTILRAHLGLGQTSIAMPDRIETIAAAVILVTGPLLLCAVLMPPQHRVILGAPRPSLPRIALRAGKLLATLLGLAMLLFLALSIGLGLPLALRFRLGGLSTLLTLILLLPAWLAAILSLIRLLTGLPAIALGLPMGLAEGWAIGRGHMGRAACLFAVALLPAALAQATAIWGGADPVGWPMTIALPVSEALSVSLTASCTGLLYRAFRLPLAFRPDRRPSHNLAQRRDPVLT